MKDLEFDYIDNIFTKIQGNSHFYWFIAFPVGFAYCYNYSRLLPFLVLMPKLLCSFNGGSDWISCNEVEACSNSITLYQVDYSSEGTITNWITELNLACLSKFSIGLFGSSYFLGNVIGALTFVRLGDIVGRRPVLISGAIFYWIFGIAMYFNTNLYVMYFLLLMIGISGMVRYSQTFILMDELLPKDRRKRYYGAITVLESLMSFVVVGCCWIFRSTYLMIVIMIILSFFQIIFSCLSPESPRFLYSVGKYKEMNESLSYIAKINGTTYTKDANIENNKSRSDSNETQIVGFLNSIKNDSVYRKNLFIMAFNWCVCSIASYITLFYVGMYPGNLYINAMMLFTGDTISTVSLSTFVNYFGFTRGFNIAFMSVFATTIIFEIFSNFPEITYVCVLITRIGIIQCFTMNYLCQSEYFKPNISARTFAFCHVLARTLPILSPIIVNTVPHSILIITVMTFIASISSKYLEKQ